MSWNGHWLFACNAAGIQVPRVPSWNESDASLLKKVGPSRTSFCHSDLRTLELGPMCSHCAWKWLSGLQSTISHQHVDSFSYAPAAAPP